MITLETKKLIEILNLAGYATKKSSALLTQMITLETKNGSLYAYTFDRDNFLKIKITDTTDSLFATVDYISLLNIIKAIKADTVELSTNDVALQIKSKTLKSKLPLCINSDGNIARVVTHDIIPTTNVLNTENFKHYMNVFKSVIVEDFVVPCYRHIYFGDNIIATNTDNAILIDDTVFNANILLKSSSIILLSNIDNVMYTIKDNKLYVTNDNIELLIVGQEMTDYQYNDFVDLFSTTLDYSCNINGDVLNNALNTSKLFNYDVVNLSFSDNGIMLTIPDIDFSYTISEEKCIPYVYSISKDTLKKLIVSKDDMIISYGDPSMIKIDCSNIHGLFSVEEVNAK